MKRSIIILVLGVLLNVSLKAQIEPIQPQDQEKTKYPIESGTIEYTMSMMGSDNPMTIRFKNGGKMQSTDVEMSMFGMTQHSRSILIDNMMYELNMAEKTYKESELTEEQAKKNATFLSDEKAMEEEGFTKGEKENFLGKSCQIYTMNKDGADVKFWSWEGLVLKMESSAQGMTVSLVAKSISEGEPDDMYFEIPSDFTKQE
jgi:hypothetical protein